MKIITALLFSLLSAFCFAAIDTFNFADAQQEADYHQLTQSLRCPQCQNNSIADSNAGIAVDMREKVFELLQQGKSQKEVVQYMVDRYGHFATYDPPVTPATIMLWILPALLIVFGGIIVFKRKKSIQATQSAVSNSAVLINNNLTKEQQQRLAKLLENKEN